MPSHYTAKSCLIFPFDSQQGSGFAVNLYSRDKWPSVQSLLSQTSSGAANILQTRSSFHYYGLTRQFDPKALTYRPLVYLCQNMISYNFFCHINCLGKKLGSVITSWWCSGLSFHLSASIASWPLCGVLPVHPWVFSRDSGFFPQIRNIHMLG